MEDYKYCTGCKVGTGWMSACESLQPGVTEALKEIVRHHEDEDVEIVVTGALGLNTRWLPRANSPGLPPPLL